jgi:hypothetical protein
MKYESTKDMMVDKPVTAISESAARVAAAAAATFVVLLVALHLINPDLDPSWRVVSEYAIGDYGWMMTLAFLVLALSCVALFVAIRAQARSVGGRVGLGILLIAASGLIIAAAFPTDPITASKDALTTDGRLHALGTALGVTFPVAAALISRSLARRSGARPSARRSLLWAAGLTWIGFLAFALSVAIMLPQNDGRFGSSVLIGWPNRFMMLTFSVWLLIVARGVSQVMRRGRQAPSELARTMS